MTVINGKEIASTEAESPKDGLSVSLRNTQASTSPPGTGAPYRAHGDGPAGARLTCMPTQISHSPRRHALKLFSVGRAGGQDKATARK